MQPNLFELWKPRQRYSLTSQVESGSRVSKATIISMAFLPFSTSLFFFSLLFLSCSSSSASSSSSSPPPPPLSSSFCSSSFSFFFYGVSLRGFFLLVVCCCVAAGSHSLASLASTTWCPTANKNAQKEDSNPVLKIKKKKRERKREMTLIFT